LFRANERFSQGLDHTRPPKSNVEKWRISDNSNVLNIPAEWLQIVNQYSRRALTYPNDRLPALSAIARVFCKGLALDDPSHLGANSQHYLAGLWRINLEYQLFWIQCSSPLSPRPDPPHRPTWSWTSVGGTVGFHPISTTCNFSIQSARTVLATDDKYGDVTSGSLEVQCHPLIPAILTSEKTVSIDSVAIPYKEVNVHLDEPVHPPEVFILHGATTVDGDEVGIVLQATLTERTYRRVGVCRKRVETLRLKRKSPVSKVLLPFDAGKSGQTIITIV